MAHAEWCPSLVVIKAKGGTIVPASHKCACNPAEAALRKDWETGGYECTWEDFKKWARNPIRHNAQEGDQ